MFCFLNTAATFKAVKKSLRTSFVKLTSSQMDEALADAAGFKTYAALMAARATHPVITLDQKTFFDRLDCHGYSSTFVGSDYSSFDKINHRENAKTILANCNLKVFMKGSFMGGALPKIENSPENAERMRLFIADVERPLGKVITIGLDEKLTDEAIALCQHLIIEDPPEMPLHAKPKAWPELDDWARSTLIGQGHAPEVIAHLRERARISEGLILISGNERSSMARTMEAWNQDTHSHKVYTVEDPPQYPGRVTHTIVAANAPDALQRFNAQDAYAVRSLNGILHILSLRKPCPTCSQSVTHTSASSHGLNLDVVAHARRTGNGCERCQQTGHMGTTVCSEWWEINTSGELQRWGMSAMAQARQKALAGLVAFDEVNWTD